MSEDTKSTCFVVYHETGCTCCSYENFIEGPWRTREAADARVKEAHDHKLLASQYAPNGRHSIEEVPYVQVQHVIVLCDTVAVIDGFIEDGQRHDHTIPYLPLIY